MSHVDEHPASGPEGFRGPLIRPNDQGYHEAREIWNALMDKRPGLIARCTGTADVVAAVNFARDSGQQLAVRGGGHSFAGKGTCDGGVMIDLSLMRGVRVDPERRIAIAQGGARWGEFDRETQLFGLATPGGVVSTTGIAGLTLGGGIGILTRQFGLSSDNLLEVEIVTADGRVHTANEGQNPELFWGVRGGGGNFGAVTSLTYRLHPVGPIILGGLILWPAEDAAAVLQAFATLAESAPTQLGLLCVVMSAPDVDPVPHKLRGKPAVGVQLCWTGETKQGEELIRPLRQTGTPAVDMIGPIPYTVLQTLNDALAGYGNHNYSKSGYLTELSPDTIDALVETAALAPSPLSRIEIGRFDGAVSEVPPESTAFGGKRHSCYVHNIVGTWRPGESDEANIGWTQNVFDALEPYGDEGVYINFLGDEGDQRIRAAYGPDKYKRLTALKRQIDPNNLFNLNQNINPNAEL